MFEVTGTIKNTTYDRQQVSASDLVDMFDLPIDKAGKKTILQFELVPDRVKYDRHNRMMAFQQGAMLRSLISGSFQGNHVNIQYFTRRNNKRVGGTNEITYTPHHVEYSGREMAFSLDVNEYPRDFENLVFYMLCTKCKDSPIHGEVPEKYYQINDTIAKAEEFVAKQTRMFEVQSVIMKPDADMHLLRTKAAGMGIQEGLLQDVEVRAELMKLANNDIESFWKQFESVTTSFDGIIARAIDLGVIISKNKGGGVQEYGFNGQISNRDFSTPFSPLAQYVVGQDGRAALKSALSKTPEMVKTINTYIEEIGEEKDIQTQLNDDMFRSTQKQAAALKDAKQDQYELAAEWAIKNKLITVSDDGNASYQQSKTKKIEVGPVNIDEDLSPQIAFLLSEKGGKEAFDAIESKMNK